MKDGNIAEFSFSSNKISGWTLIHFMYPQVESQSVSNLAIETRVGQTIASYRALKPEDKN